MISRPPWLTTFASVAGPSRRSTCGSVSPFFGAEGELSETGALVPAADVAAPGKSTYFARAVMMPSGVRAPEGNPSS